MKTKNMVKIWKYIKSCEHGNNIEGIMKHVDLARGTIRTNLFYLMLTDNVLEYCYGQNNKIYKVKNQEYQNKGFLNSVVIN